MSDMPQVTDNAAASRFELTQGGELAELVYRRRANRLILVHTEVPVGLEGHGIGGQLIRAAIARAAAEGLTVVPLCPFAQDWLGRHPDVAATVKIDFGDQPGA
jgi:predicted GNAT family acetyltransferase